MKVFENPVRLLKIGLVLLSVFYAGHLLYSALCAFSWHNYLMSDYGVYTNTIWNLAHGNGFTFLVTHNYLKTHLSFSLVMLAPFFYLWDSPLLLIFIQWGFFVSGALFLVVIFRREKIPGLPAVAIVFFYVVSPFTQSVMLSEFHGVSAYLLLVPALYYCVLYQKALVIFPYLLILGLREDAGFLLPVFLVYMARRENWKAGYGYALGALLYAMLSVLWLYPLINGVSLLDVRQEELTAGWPGALWIRLLAVFRFLAVCLPFFLLRNRRAVLRPLILIPLIPLLLVFFSGYERQYALLYHYPAAPLAFLAVAMVQAFRERGGDRASRRLPALSARTAAAFSLLLAGIVLWGHAKHGLLVFGGNENRIYTRVHPQGWVTWNVSRMIPKEGILLCHQRLAAYCANRENITIWRQRLDSVPPESVDLYFIDKSELRRSYTEEIHEALKTGTHGVWKECPPYLLLRRGADTENNADLLRELGDGCTERMQSDPLPSAMDKAVKKELLNAAPSDFGKGRNTDTAE